jgi:hypothetical protein
MINYTMILDPRRPPTTHPNKQSGPATLPTNTNVYRHAQSTLVLTPFQVGPWIEDHCPSAGCVSPLLALLGQSRFP